MSCISYIHISRIWRISLNSYFGNIFSKMFISGLNTSYLSYPRGWVACTVGCLGGACLLIEKKSFWLWNYVCLCFDREKKDFWWSLDRKWAMLNIWNCKYLSVDRKTAIFGHIKTVDIFKEIRHNTYTQKQTRFVHFFGIQNFVILQLLSREVLAFFHASFQFSLSIWCIFKISIT